MRINFIGVICITLMPYAIGEPRTLAKDKAGNVYYQLTPDERLHFCCRSEKIPKNGIPKKCYNVCSYTNIKAERIVNELVRCGSDALYYVLTCAARFGDHSQCCHQQGVPRKCLMYCKPSVQVEAGGQLPPDLDCLTHLEKIKFCFRDFDRRNPAWMLKDEYNRAAQLIRG